MGLIKAGIYLGATTYIIKKIKEDKNQKAPQNNQAQYPSYPPQQDTRNYPPPPPPQYYPHQQYAPQDRQQQQPKFGYYDTHGPYEAQWQAAAPERYETQRIESGRREERGNEWGVEKRGSEKVEDEVMPRQWPGAEERGSSKW